MLLQLLLVVIVIFVPQTVTVFLDKEEKIDLDKVTIEMPVDAPDPAASEPDLDELFRDRAPAADPAAAVR